MNPDNKTRKLALIGLCLFLAGSIQDPGGASAMFGFPPPPARGQSAPVGEGQDRPGESGRAHQGISREGAVAMAFPISLLETLEPTEAEAEKLAVAGIGWKRILPLSAEESVEIVVNHYRMRSSRLFVRARIDGDDLSLLTMVVSGSLVKGHLTIPGEVDYAVTTSGKMVELSPLDDLSWSCSHSG